jgi:acetyltransferase
MLLIIAIENRVFPFYKGIFQSKYMTTDSTRYVCGVSLKGGISVQLRPIRPDDEVMEKDFIQRLGPDSEYNRFFGYFKNPSPDKLRLLCNVDYETEMAIVALISPRMGSEMIIGVGRMIESTQNRAELAVVVADEFQHLGLGTKLVKMLLNFAKDRKFSSIYAAVLPDNGIMLRMLKEKFNFKISYSGEGLVIAELPIELTSPKLESP